jgi:hypothetical protein
MLNKCPGLKYPSNLRLVLERWLFYGAVLNGAELFPHLRTGKSGERRLFRQFCGKYK